MSDRQHQAGGSPLQAFDPAYAALVSTWASTPAEVRSWCGLLEAPVPPSVVAATEASWNAGQPAAHRWMVQP